MTPLDIVREAAFAAVDRKAARPILMDLRGVSDLADYQFVCSGDNERHTRAIAEAIEERCRTIGGVKPVATEGKQTGNWVLLDYGPAVIHVFYNYLRDYYALESLWPRAKFVNLASLGIEGVPPPAAVEPPSGADS